MKKTNLLGIKMTEEFRKVVDDAAKSQDMTAASFARLCLEICTPIPGKIWDYIESLSEKYNRHQSEIVIIIIAKYLCDFLARQKVSPNKPHVVQEFVPIEGDFSIDDLFNMLQKISLNQVEKEQANELELKILRHHKTKNERVKDDVIKQLVQNKILSEKEAKKLFSAAEYEVDTEISYFAGYPTADEFKKYYELKKDK